MLEPSSVHEIQKEIEMLCTTISVHRISDPRSILDPRPPLLPLHTARKRIPYRIDNDIRPKLNFWSTSRFICNMFPAGGPNMSGAYGVQSHIWNKSCFLVRCLDILTCKLYYYRQISLLLVLDRVKMFLPQIEKVLAFG